jgi:hypothetical protein
MGVAPLAGKPGTDKVKVLSIRQFTGLLLLGLLISHGCSPPPETGSQSTGSQSPQATAPASPIHTLSLADYPPAGVPYYIESGDFWLVHTAAGRLLAFAPVSPEYAEQIAVDECRFAWSRPVQRFVDPCSGDEWELDGRLNLAHSTEMWSSRDLDQYAVTAEDDLIYVHPGQRKPGASRAGSPP